MFKVFNPNGTDKKEHRQIFAGNSTGIINLNNVKYEWAIQLWRQMRENFWIAEKIDLSMDVVTYNQLTPEEKRAFDGILAYLVFLDSVQVSNIPHIVRPCTAPEVSMCFGEQMSQECFDTETELLTSKGWKNVAQVNEQDELAQYDINTSQITFSLPTKVHRYFYKGDMILFESKNTSICVTPNHDLIKIHPSRKTVSKDKADNIIGGNYLYPKTGTFIGDSDIALSEMEKLLIAVAADGHIRIMKNGNRHVQIGLSKTRKMLKLEELLDNLEISYHKKLEICGSRFRYGFNIPQDWKGVEITNDSVKAFDFVDDLTSISPKKAQEMIEEICFWDGNTTRKTNYFFYSTNKQAIDIVQIIAMIAGYSAQVSINRTEEQALKQKMPFSLKPPKTAKTCYLVSISKNYQTKTFPNPQKHNYEDYVYCVSVPKENIVSRRNGKVAITGNSLHAQSYQYIIESIIPPEKRDDIYEYWREDKVLLERCKLIGDYYQEYIDNPTEESYIITLIADYILEGIFFYTGFIFFYNLASRSLMCGSADIFKMINRDELSHVRLYQKLIQEKMKGGMGRLVEFYLKDMVQEAVKAEIKWSEHIIGENILGMPLSAVSEYIKYLANTRLKAVGIEPIYDNPKNPFKHLEKIADTSKNAHVKTNFFDATVTSYQMSSTIEDWDF